MKLGQELFVLVDAQNQLVSMPDGGGLLMESIEEAISEAEMVGRYLDTTNIWIKRVKLVEAT